MRCIVVKSGEFENSYSLLYILFLKEKKKQQHKQDLKILFMLLLARYARSEEMNFTNFTCTQVGGLQASDRSPDG